MNQRVLNLEGAHYQQGVIHGRQASKLIANNLTSIKSWIERDNPFDFNRIVEMIKSNELFLIEHQKELIEELQGIADGSGLPYEDILLMNVPVYFVLNWLPCECSQFAQVIRDSNSHKKTFAAKTRDNSGGPWEHVVLVRNYLDGLKMIEVGFAGIVTFPGSILTNRGVSVTTSGVWSERIPFELDSLQCGELLPNSHMLAKYISSIDDVKPYLERAPRLSGMNYIVTTPGRIAAFEVTSDSVAYFMECGASVAIPAGCCILLAPSCLCTWVFYFIHFRVYLFHYLKNGVLRIE